MILLNHKRMTSICALVHWLENVTWKCALDGRAALQLRPRQRQRLPEPHLNNCRREPGPQRCSKVSAPCLALLVLRLNWEGSYLISMLPSLITPLNVRNLGIHTSVTLGTEEFSVTLLYYKAQFRGQWHFYWPALSDEPLIKASDVTYLVEEPDITKIQGWKKVIEPAHDTWNVLYLIIRWLPVPVPVLPELLQFMHFSLKLSFITII